MEKEIHKLVNLSLAFGLTSLVAHLLGVVSHFWLLISLKDLREHK
jgi:hypothetical protein